VTNDQKRMLEVVPEHIHDRSGIFMGSYDEIKKVNAVYAKHGIVAK
jgi:fructose-1,6-bisphosphatase I